MNGPIGQPVPLRMLPLEILFLGSFLLTHSCLNNCTDISRVKTELTVKEDKCCCPFIRNIYITVLAPVVQTFYGEMNQTNHYPVDKYYGYQLRYPLDGDLSSE